jgi:hypothetical protein
VIVVEETWLAPELWSISCPLSTIPSTVKMLLRQC